MDAKELEMLQNQEQNPLSSQQLQAISLLLAGKNLTAISRQLRCTRKTLAKWKTSNPHFIAAFNSAKNEMFEGANNRLQSLVDKAIGVLEKNLDDGNCAAAFQVLKIIDLKQKELETDVEILVKQQAEKLAMSQIYDVVPFATKPWSQISPQTERLAMDVCETLRTYYGIGPDQLEELQCMSEDKTPEKLIKIAGGKTK